MECDTTAWVASLGVVCPALAPARLMGSDGGRMSIGWMEMRKAAWFLSSNGVKQHGDDYETNCSRFSEGSIVTFSLDLRQESRGKLSFSVSEGSQEHVIFECLNSVRMNNGLLPALYARGPSQFEILSMESE